MSFSQNVAASIPTAIAVQNAEAQIGGSANNLRQIAIACHPIAPNPNLPGVFGTASFEIRLFADIGGGGYGTLSDPFFSEINSHIRINSTVRTSNDTYTLRGTIERSQSGELLGKSVVFRSQVLDNGGNCDLSLTIGSPGTAGILIGLLVPAVQSLRDTR